MLAYLAREHNETSQTRKVRKTITKRTKKPTGTPKNVTQQDVLVKGWPIAYILYTQTKPSPFFSCHFISLSFLAPCVAAQPSSSTTWSILPGTWNLVPDLYLYAYRVLLLPPLLLFVMVCRMAKFVAGSLILLPVFSICSFKRDLFLVYSLAVLSQLQPRFAYDTASSVINSKSPTAQ